MARSPKKSYYVELNDSGSNKYKCYTNVFGDDDYGSTYEQLTLMRSEGRTPITYAQLAKKRLEVLASCTSKNVSEELKLSRDKSASEQVRSSWFEFKFMLGDGIYFAPIKPW